jgi:hypothetical protein
MLNEGKSEINETSPSEEEKKSSNVRKRKVLMTKINAKLSFFAFKYGSFFLLWKKKLKEGK